MMITIESVLSFVLSLHLFHGDADKSEAEKREYLRPVAVAMHSAATRQRAWPARRAIVWLGTLGEAESHFAHLVVTGNCREHAERFGPNCDGFRAIGPWQQQLPACRAAWDRVEPELARVRPVRARLPEVEIDQTTLILLAECAVARGINAQRLCENRKPWSDIAGAFSAYRRWRCDEDFAQARARRFLKLFVAYPNP